MSVVTHWSIAVLIIALLASGPVIAALPEGVARGALIHLHKEAGIIAILLTPWRIAWHSVEPETPPATAMERWKARARRFMHVFLVVGSLVVSVSGVMMSLCHGYDVPVLAIFALPAQAEIAAIAVPARFVHGIGGDLLMIAVAFHAAALKHHFVDHDRTFVRMLGKGARGGRRLSPPAPRARRRAARSTPRAGRRAPTASTARPDRW